VLYPIFADPISTVEFTDQYGFRPTGSTTDAVIALLDDITFSGNDQASLGHFAIIYFYFIHANFYFI